MASQAAYDTSDSTSLYSSRAPATTIGIPKTSRCPSRGAYGYPYNSFIPTNFLDNVWAEDNPDAYFIRPRSNMSTGGYLRDANDRYLQNARYLRLKNLTVGYTIPAKVTKKAGIDQVREASPEKTSITGRP